MDIAKLAKTIGYPQEVPAEAEAFDFIVDGEVVSAKANGERLLFTTVLTEDEDASQRLAGLAAGRLLKEDAVLAWDPERRAVILWQETSAASSAARDFERFLESCDWWRERVRESGALDDSPLQTMRIRP